MTDLPYVNRWTPPSTEEQVAASERARRLREEFAAKQAAELPARRSVLSAGPALRDVAAAMVCACSCHPRPAQSELHRGGVSCPCQSTPEERSAAFSEFLESSRSLSTEWEVRQESVRQATDAEAARLGAEVVSLGGAAPFVIQGRVDGRAFYLRERHDQWSVVIAPDDDPLADPWTMSREIPTITVASGDSSAFDTAGRFDEVRALTVAVDAVRLFLLRRSCTHEGAGRFCAVCGVEVSAADAWRIHARRAD